MVTSSATDQVSPRRRAVEISPTKLASNWSTLPHPHIQEVVTPIRQLALALLGIGIGLAFTPIALFVSSALKLHDLHILYMIPVIIAATRYGLACALATALTGSAMAAYFFYAPFYSLVIIAPSDVVSLVTFVVVAIITSHLSTMVRENAAAADRNFRELQRLYGLSRDLAAASTPDEMRAAIRAHVSSLIGGQVWLAREGADGLMTSNELPAVVREALKSAPNVGSTLVFDPNGQSHWLLRALPGQLGPREFLIAEIGAGTPDRIEPVRARIDTLLDQSIGTVERLDLAKTVAEAEGRRQSASLKEAVIGSASHGLRTPLASILGAASILSEATPVKSEARLSQLAALIVGEAERLNGDIQKMLDAATLSASGLKPTLVWTEVSDIVNAAVEAKKRETSAHTVVVDCADGLPFVRADAALAREALGLLLDNAARYSPAGTTIEISVRHADEIVSIDVDDEGVGFDDRERARLTEKFYRGERVRDSTRGSGLGLWIADAVMTACDGKLAIAARSGGVGSRVTLTFPAGVETSDELPDNNDD